MGELGEGCQKVQNSRYKVNEYWDIMYSIVTIISNALLYTADTISDGSASASMDTEGRLCYAI